MKKVLVVIDAQNDFINGSLRNEDAIKAIPNLVKKIRSFDGDEIFVTQDTHEKYYLETPEGKKLPVVHCVDGTEGWKLNANVSAALDDAKLRNINVTYIKKPTFGSYELVDKIKELYINGVETVDIEFIGFCTDICVVSNVFLIKAALYDIANITVDASCCAGVTPETHIAALTTMKMCQIDVINE